MCNKIILKRRFVILFLILIFTCTLANISADRQTAYAQNVTAETAMELETGTVLEECNASVKLPMASTTKIMTALIISEETDLEKVVTVPDEAVGVEGSSVYLKKQEKINVKDLLYGLMLRSGNDCATALAIIHSGSVTKFADKMNEKAKLIGAYDTNFTNPSGLPDDNHYTTAHDLALIACAAMKNDIFREVVATKSYKGEYRSFTNKNKMLYNYDGANGIKTGYTVKAGRCLVSSAKRGNMDVVCVVLNCYDMYNRSKQILDSCFNNYELNTISQNKTFLCNGIPVKPKEDAKIVIKKGSGFDYEIIPYESPQINENGKKTGKLKIFAGNSLIFQTDLYSI